MLSTFLTAGAITAAGACLWVHHFYRHLAREVHHTKIDHAGRKASAESGKLESLPTDLIQRPDGFRVLHEKSEKAIPNLKLPNDGLTEDRLFTELLRRDMGCFTQMPQSWMMWLILRKGKLGRTFSPTHIKTLDFQEGDVFCGVYRVSKRRAMKVEIEMVSPEGFPPLHGMLVIAVDRGARGGVVFRTETLQWTDVDSGVVLPLERAVLRFMHEMASWWLLLSGVEYLTWLVELDSNI